MKDTLQHVAVPHGEHLPAGRLMMAGGAAAAALTPGLAVGLEMQQFGTVAFSTAAARTGA